MDIFTALNPETRYSNRKLQVIMGAWVASALFDRNSKVKIDNGHVIEDDYTKQSIYALLYSLYREVGPVKSEHGETYEFTFNTWGYDWPKTWGTRPTHDRDPQRFGKFAYTGLFEHPEVKEYVAARDGRIHIVEMGCGTGAGADHICGEVWPECTYQAIDMQGAAIQTCERKHVPNHNGRLQALHADVTKADIASGSADIVVINETHVTEHPGIVTEEDKKFFAAVARVLKPGGFFVWGNAIPAVTWEPCFAFLESQGLDRIRVHDVTKEAVLARDLDEARAEAYVEQCLNKFHGFKIPVIGTKRRREAEQALKNFYRHPGTNLYNKMVDGTDTYLAACFQKPA